MKNNLRAIRKHRKKTLREVADEVGVSYQSISHYENSIRLPTIDVINKLASYYQVDSNLLFPNNNDPLPPEFLGGDDFSHEGLIKYNNPVKKVAIFSQIDYQDLTKNSDKIIDQDYIYRFGTGTGRYFGWLINSNDFEPFYYKNDILIFRTVNGIDLHHKKHNRVFLSIEKDKTNRLYRMSAYEDVYLMDILTNEVSSFASFDRNKIVGQLIEIHKRVEF